MHYTNHDYKYHPFLTVPAPSSIMVSSIPIRPAGTDVTVTCTVELSNVTDIPVTVNMVWTGPAGFNTTKITQHVTGSTTTYISTVMVNSFRRDQSGVYTCTATVRPMKMSEFLSDSNSLSERMYITVG